MSRTAIIFGLGIMAGLAMATLITQRNKNRQEQPIQANPESISDPTATIERDKNELRQRFPDQQLDASRSSVEGRSLPAPEADRNPQASVARRESKPASIPGVYLGADSLPPRLRELALEKLGNPDALEVAVSFHFSDSSFSAAFVHPNPVDGQTREIAARWHSAESAIDEMIQARIQQLDSAGDFLEFESKQAASEFKAGEPDREIAIRLLDGVFRVYDLTSLTRTPAFVQRSDESIEHSAALRSGGFQLQNLRYDDSN